MKKLIPILAVLLCLGAVAAGSGAWFVYHAWTTPADFAEDQMVIVTPGSTVMAVAQQVKATGYFTPYDVIYRLVLHFQPISIKAGEYALPAHSSLQQVFAILGSGNVVRRNFTIPEGLTVKQIARSLQDGPFPDETLVDLPAEGSLLPDTYFFTHEDTAVGFLAQMSKADAALLDDLWAKRDMALPLHSIAEAVTLASIVEKETGLAGERPRIAGLFYNRLRIGMPLQSDPTVVYAITDRLGSMEGKRLYGKDLQVESPYNTYRVTGLPPGPICNPGRASLEAVLHPETHDFLYFVADGSGGHVFAKTLDEHNKNVQAWRVIRKQREAAPP